MESTAELEFEFKRIVTRIYNICIFYSIFWVHVNLHVCIYFTYISVLSTTYSLVTLFPHYMF
jgi:hypothetical protein